MTTDNNMTTDNIVCLEIYDNDKWKTKEEIENYYRKAFYYLKKKYSSNIYHEDIKKALIQFKKENTLTKGDIKNKKQQNSTILFGNSEIQIVKQLKIGAREDVDNIYEIQIKSEKCVLKTLDASAKYETKKHREVVNTFLTGNKETELGKITAEYFPSVIHTSFDEDSRQIYLVIQFANGEPLYDYCPIKEKPYNSDEKTNIFKLFKIFFELLDKIHDEGFFFRHFDLHPKNIFMGNNGELMIIDLGESFVFKNSNKLKSIDIQNYCATMGAEIRTMSWAVSKCSISRGLLGIAKSGVRAYVGKKKMRGKLATKINTTNVDFLFIYKIMKELNDKYQQIFSKFITNLANRILIDEGNFKNLYEKYVNNNQGGGYDSTLSAYIKIKKDYKNLVEDN